MKIHVVDTLQLGRSGIIAATALETTDGIVLFDTGPESTYQNVVDGLGRVGIAPNDVRRVVLSHIHFDHAGAAWRFAELGADVFVHARGAPHLIDPSRLNESARRIFGDQMERLWGRIAPVPKDRVRIVADDEHIRAGQFDIRAIETPGHASHHHVYTWDGHLFGGDVAGVRIKSGPPIPPFVPPELDIDAWQRSIERMVSLGATDLHLPHYGRVEGNLAAHFAELSRRVTRWGDWFREQLRAGASEETLKSSFAALEHGEVSQGTAAPEVTELIDDYEAADPSYMAVTAATRYWRKREQF